MHNFYMQTPWGCIHCCQWLPKGNPVGIVQIVHGISEYVARYDHFARFLAENGYLVVGGDHPGHGGSVGEEDQFGYMTGGWDSAVKIVHLIHKKTVEEYPELPYFILGHSMGSFLLRTYLFTYRDSLAGVLISGTAWQPAAVLAAGLAVCAEEAARLGERNHSELLQTLAFGTYNKQFAPNRTPYDWISSDEHIVDAYGADSYCTWKPSVQLIREMMRGIQKNQKRDNLSRMDKSLPVFFFAGQLDPVGNMGNGVLKSVQAFKQAGMQDVLVELYPNMRHECHNEIGKEKVYDDVLAWLEEKRK